MITNLQNDDLVADISDDEVEQVVRSLHPYKAPSPDGFSPLFF